jgi:hypothetical protein
MARAVLGDGATFRISGIYNWNDLFIISVAEKGPSNLGVAAPDA